MNETDTFALRKIIIAALIFTLIGIILGIFNVFVYIGNLNNGFDFDWYILWRVFGLLIISILFYMLYKQVVKALSDKKFINIYIISIVITLLDLFYWGNFSSIALALMLILINIAIRKGRINKYYFFSIIPMIALILFVGEFFLSSDLGDEIDFAFWGNTWEVAGFNQAYNPVWEYTIPAFLDISLLVFGFGLLTSKKKTLIK